MFKSFKSFKKTIFLKTFKYIFFSLLIMVSFYKTATALDFETIEYVKFKKDKYSLEDTIPLLNANSKCASDQGGNKRTCYIECAYYNEADNNHNLNLVYVYRYNIRGSSNYNNYEILYAVKYPNKADDSDYNDYKGPNTQNYIFSDSGRPEIMFETSFDEGCPEYAYIDTGYYNELCFDNGIEENFDTGSEIISDKEWCVNRNNPGTNYGKNGQLIKFYDAYDELIKAFKESAHEGVAKFMADNMSIDNIDETLSNMDDFESDIVSKIQENIDNVYDSEFQYKKGGTVFNNILMKLVNEMSEGKYVSDLTDKVMGDFTYNYYLPDLTRVEDTDYQFKMQCLYSYFFTDDDTVTYHHNTAECKKILPKKGEYKFHDIIKAAYINDFQSLNNQTFINNCKSLLGSPTDRPNNKNSGSPAYYLQFVLNVAKYVAIIITIVFGIIDFVSAIASKDNDIINKTISKSIKRLIICVVIFFVPIILEFVFTLVDIYSPSTCGIS